MFLVHIACKGDRSKCMEYRRYIVATYNIWYWDFCCAYHSSNQGLHNVFGTQFKDTTFIWNNFDSFKHIFEAIILFWWWFRRVRISNIFCCCVFSNSFEIDFFCGKHLERTWYNNDFDIWKDFLFFLWYCCCRTMSGIETGWYGGLISSLFY